MRILKQTNTDSNKTRGVKKPASRRGMVFYWVIGLVVILFIMSQSIMYQIRNEIFLANYIMRAEIVNSVCDAMIEEAFMEVRLLMNDHKKVHGGSDPYSLLRCGWGNPKPPAISVDTPITINIAKKEFGMNPSDMSVSVTYEQVSPYKKDLMGNERKPSTMSQKESFGVLKVVAKASLGDYTKAVTACKDIKVVKVLPPFPGFSLFVRNGGTKASKYNHWPAYHGVESLAFRVLSGANAAKAGKIVFGGGYSRYEGDQLLGFKPMPKKSQLQEGEMPIIINLTNAGALNYDGGTLLGQLRTKNFNFPSDIGSKYDFVRCFPSFDFWARCKFGDDTDKESLAARLIEPSLKSGIPLPPTTKLVVTPPASSSGSSSASKEVELDHRWQMLGAGIEIGLDGEDSHLKPFTPKKLAAPGYLNYFENYIKFCDTEDREYLNPKYAGIDLFATDIRQGRDYLKPEITHVYGNVLAGNLEAYALNVKDDAYVLPWVNFEDKDFTAQKSVVPKKLAEENTDRTFFQSLQGMLGLSEAQRDKFKFIPHFGKNKKGAGKPIDTPATLLEAATRKDNSTDQVLETDTKNIAYKHVMSRPKFGSYDVSEGPEVATIIDTVPYNKEEVNVNKLAETFPLDLAPEMACYSFANAKDFIYNLYYMKKLIPPEESEDKQWHLYLDGIWYVEGMKAFEERFQQLRLPPDAPNGGPLYINGKGVIASIFGTDVLLNGVMKDKDSDDDLSQLSIISAPNPLYEKISKLPSEIRDTIFSSQNGDIWVTDTYIQASVCAGIGTLRYMDNPKVTMATAGSIFPFHGPDSKKDDHQNNFDSFFIRGNLIVNYLNLEKLECKDEATKKMVGGGTVAYDEKLFPERTGTGDHEANYVVNLSQCYTFYKIEIIKDKGDDEPKVSTASE
jgi:hypothetical protein